MDVKTKELMIKQRLDEYERKIFMIEMDLTAAKAIGDNQFTAQCEKNIDELKKAYAAVEAM